MNNLIRGQYSEKVCEKAWPFAVVASLAVTSVATWNFTRSSEVNADENGSNAKIKNVIVLIGDGMGPSYMTAHRYMKDNPKTFEMESTEFDKHLVGTQKHIRKMNMKILQTLHRQQQLCQQGLKHIMRQFQLTMIKLK